MIGTTLAHFKITARLGEGGMGEVYRAQDTRLGRDVAIKMLPDQVAADPERLARFEREARTLAGLNHPNIAGIHQVEEAGGKRLLVMELVEGEDLQKRLDRGVVPVDEALRLARQVAEALEAAHGGGVIHRDLKPANVMVTPEGRVKVLDFGLAKALDPVTGDSGERTALLSHSPTLTANMTHAGVILGTAAYMSPEQARGADVDRRADIWSFGVLLFEMLTGRRTFTGNTATDVIAAVVTREPDWERLPADTPAQVRRLLRRCTRKEPGERLHDIADARIALDEAIANPEAWVDPAAAAASGPPRLGLLAAVAAGGLALGAALWSALGPAPAPAPARAPATEPTHVMVEVPEGREVRRLNISPDGRTLAYIGRELREGERGEPTSRVFLRPLGSTETREVPDTEGARWVVFSPDGRWLAYFIRDGEGRDGILHKMAVSGGPAVTVQRIRSMTFWFLPTWRDDDRMMISDSSAILAVPMNGGEPETIVSVDDLEAGPARVILSSMSAPDGDHLLLTVGYVADGAYAIRTDMVSLSTGENRPFQAAGGAVHLFDGILLSWAQNVVMATPIDMETLQVTGASVPLFSTEYLTALGAGTLARVWSAHVDRLPVLTDADGSVTPLTGFDSGGFQDFAETSNLRWSPDGKYLALVIFDGAYRKTLHLYDVERELLSPLGFPGQVIGSIAWHPDGEQIAFSARSEEPGESLYLRSAAGNDSPRLLLAANGEEGLEPFGWSPDGTTLAIARHGEDTTTIRSSDAADIYMLNVASGDLEPFARTPAYEHTPTFSPDGRWVAFESDESGRKEVFVARYPAQGADGNPRKLRVSTGGGQFAEWSSDGRTLYFTSLGGKLMMADVQAAGDDLRFGVARPLFDLSDHSLIAEGAQEWAPRPGGDDFAFLLEEEPPASRHIEVILDWDIELRRALASAR